MTKTTKYIPLPDASIDRETDKAVLIAAGYSHDCGHGSRKFWFPKSQFRLIDGVVYVAAWLLSKKESEIAEEYRGFHGFHANADADSIIEL